MGLTDRRQSAALWVMIPAVLTAAGCLLAPVVYLRYALPVVCALPLWLAAATAPGIAAQAEAEMPTPTGTVEPEC